MQKNQILQKFIQFKFIFKPRGGLPLFIVDNANDGY